MGENDVKFIIVFNEENRYILLEQDEFFVFFIYVVKFLGIRLISFMIFIDNNISKCIRIIKKCGEECKNKCLILKIKII